MKKLLFICILFITVLLGCKKQSLETVQKGEFAVEFLFEKDGCRMYRFQDCGRYIYWANCSGKVSYDITHSSGKTTYTEHLETIATR